MSIDSNISAGLEEMEITDKNSDHIRYVRIKPFDKRLGQLIRSFTFEGRKFTAERGWLPVFKEFGLRMKKCRQDPNDPNSAKVFDVCTYSEAKALERTVASTGKVSVDQALDAVSGQPVGPKDSARQPARPAPKEGRSAAELREQKDTLAGFDSKWDDDGKETDKAGSKARKNRGPAAQPAPPPRRTDPALDPDDDDEDDDLEDEDEEEGRAVELGRLAPPREEEAPVAERTASTDVSEAAPEAAPEPAATPGATSTLSAPEKGTTSTPRRRSAANSGS